jgi:hypothetical protein
MQIIMTPADNDHEVRLRVEDELLNACFGEERPVSMVRARVTFHAEHLPATPDIYGTLRMADAFSRALTPAPETLAFYARLRKALTEIKAGYYPPCPRCQSTMHPASQCPLHRQEV